MLVLLGNSSWAFQAHAEVFIGHVELEQASGEPESPLPPALDACDHCCHAQSHCLALIPPMLELCVDGRRAAPATTLVGGPNRDRDPPPLPPCI